MRCGICGQEGAPGDKFCGRCGTRLSEETPAAATQAQTYWPNTQQPPQNVYTPPAVPRRQPDQPPYSGYAQNSYGSPYAPHAYGAPATKKKKNGLPIALISVAVIAVILGVIFLPDLFKGPATFVSAGNDSRNTGTGGIVAQQGNMLFYIGGNSCLYGANTGGSDAQQLTMTPARNLAVSDGYVFYIDSQSGVLFRINPDGSGATALSDAQTEWCGVYQEKLYAMEVSASGYDVDLVVMDLDDGARTVIFAGLNPDGIDFYEDKLFFKDSNDNNLYTAALDGSGIKQVYHDNIGDIRYFVVQRGDIYYVSWSDASLYRITPGDGARMKVSGCQYNAGLTTYNGMLYLVERWDDNGMAALFEYDPAAGGAPKKVAQMDLGRFGCWFYDGVYTVGDYLYFGDGSGVRYSYKSGKTDQIFQ